MGREAIDDAKGAGHLRGTVVVLNRDLMFGMRIRNAVRSLGLEPVVVADTAAFVAAVRAGGATPVLAVVDMNGAVDWTLVRGLADDPSVETPIIGFGPHVDIEGRRAAKAAGLDRIVSNGDFHRDAVGLLRRYAARDLDTE